MSEPVRRGEESRRTERFAKSPGPGVVRRYCGSMAAPKLLLIHGPNLNMLGAREPGIYGTATLDDIVGSVRSKALEHGLELVAHQSNSESEIVALIQRGSADSAAIIINAGAFTHYSWAIHDALRSFGGPIVEVHLSNPGAREDFRHVSVMSAVVDGTISGFGPMGYRLAVEAVASRLSAS